MKNIFSKLSSFLKNAAVYARSFVVKHKIWSGILALIVIGIGYWGYSAYAASTAPTQYVLADVSRGPLVVTVTDSGTVDAKDTLNVTPQNGASGQITELTVTPGQTVKAGQIIAELDMTTAAEEVTSARQNLESAQISYQQTLSSSGASVTSDQANVTTALGNAVTALSTNNTDLPTIMNGINGILFNLSTIQNYTAEKNVDAYSNLVGSPEAKQDSQQVQEDYLAANTAYNNVQAEYASADPSTLTATQLQQLEQDMTNTDVLIETTVKDTLSYYNYINNNLVQAKSSQQNQLATQISSLTSYQSTITSDASNINSTKTSLVNAQQTLAQDTQSLGSNGNTPLNVQSAELNVQKAQASLDQALTTESYDVIRAPFDGVIGSVPVNKFDQASSGTIIATLITTEEYADLSLNEADAAKVLVGQPATMTFDAIPNLTMPGQVATIDPVGTVSQGVTTFDVKVSFAQQNSQIKPGMTVNATIITASSTNAIQVPSAAITTTGNISTVKVATLTNASSTLAQLGGSGTASSTRRSGSYGAGRVASSTGGAYGALSGAASSTGAFRGMSGTTAMTTRTLTVPSTEATVKTVPVTLGLSNDTMTQIVSGLTPGEYVVTATQAANANKTKTTAASATSLLGGSSTRGLGGATGGGYSGGARTSGAAATRPAGGG